MNSWATRSSSSVVTPGAMCLAASAIACAAIRPAIRIRSMVSLSCTSGPVYGVGAGLPTYSGRRMFPGTERTGVISPGTSSDWPDMPASLTSVSGAPWHRGKEPMMALFKKRTVGKPGEWFYCLEHKKVEEGPECPAKDRFGPYASRQEAQHAMETAQERNLEWDTDPKWHDRKGP